MRVPLNENTLYIGDNGWVTCGKLRCAGMTVHFTGHDLSGQRVDPISHPADVRAAIAESVKCEMCGLEPRLILPAQEIR